MQDSKKEHSTSINAQKKSEPVDILHQAFGNMFNNQDSQIFQSDMNPISTQKNADKTNSSKPEKKEKSDKPIASKELVSVETIFHCFEPQQGVPKKFGNLLRALAAKELPFRDRESAVNKVLNYGNYDKGMVNKYDANALHFAVYYDCVPFVDKLITMSNLDPEREITIEGEAYNAWDLAVLLEKNEATMKLLHEMFSWCYGNKPLPKKAPQKPEKVLQEPSAQATPSNTRDTKTQQIQDDKRLAKKLQSEEYSDSSSNLGKIESKNASVSLFKPPSEIFKPEPLSDEKEECKRLMDNIQNLIFALGFEKGPERRMHSRDNDVTLLFLAFITPYKPMPWEKIKVSKGPNNPAMYAVLKAAIRALEAFDSSILKRAMREHQGSYDEVSTLLKGNISFGQSAYAGFAEMMGTIADQPGYLVHQILQEASDLFEKIYKNHPSWSLHK